MSGPRRNEPEQADPVCGNGNSSSGSADVHGDDAPPEQTRIGSYSMEERGSYVAIVRAEPRRVELRQIRDRWQAEDDSRQKAHKQALETNKDAKMESHSMGSLRSLLHSAIVKKMVEIAHATADIQDSKEARDAVARMEARDVESRLQARREKWNTKGRETLGIPNHAGRR